MIITLTGLPGAGKSTIAKLLSKKLGFPRYSTGDLFRKLADEKGLTVTQLNKHSEGDKAADDEVDAFQTKLGKTEDNFIIDGRLAWHFIPHSFKIFLDIDEQVAAKRIFDASKQGKRPEEVSYESAKQVADEATERVSSERKRYQTLYNVDYLEKTNFDLVVDTSDKTPEEIVQIILEAIDLDKNN